MKAKGKKFLSLFLIFFLVALSGNLYSKEKRGADLKIQKKDGQSVRGELIAVKNSSLLLLDSESGADVSIDIKDVKAIRIRKKSKASRGWLIGGVTGSLVLGVAWLGAGGASEVDSPLAPVAGFLGGLVYGGLIGAVTGIIMGIDKTYRIEGKSDSEIKEILEKLRKKARVRNFQ